MPAPALAILFQNQEEPKGPVKAKIEGTKTAHAPLWAHAKPLIVAFSLPLYSVDIS
jgi:hypothetical protein